MPAEILSKLRAICMALPDTYEERAWVGVRWLVRKRNFAHVLCIREGRPPAYARAAGSDGPLTVVTFRATPALRDVLRDAGPRFFVPAWGTLWGTKVVGIKLTRAIDHAELSELLSESYRLLAPRKLSAAAHGGAINPRPGARRAR